MIPGRPAAQVVAAFAVLCVVAALGACSRKIGGGPPKVAVSIFPIWDLTRRVAGDKLDVLLVLPPGKSEHSYDPTPREIAQLDGTRLGLEVGLDMDLWADQIMKTTGGPRVVHLGEKVQTLAVTAGDDDPDVGAPDPHYWLDPVRMIAVTDQIAAELTSLDPADQDVFARNAAEVKASLAKLDGAIAARAKTWSKRTIVTFHGSMSYYAQRYDLTIAAVIEPLAGKDPTPADLGEALAAIKAAHAAALFSEPQLDKAPAETVSRGGGIALGELDPVGGVPGRDSYEALLTWNTDQLDKLLE